MSRQELQELLKQFEPFNQEGLRQDTFHFPPTGEVILVEYSSKLIKDKKMLSLEQLLTTTDINYVYKWIRTSDVKVLRAILEVSRKPCNHELQTIERIDKNLALQGEHS